MSLDKKYENNISQNQSSKYNNDFEKINNDKIVKKNKIINIRIYQNYSNNKNLNTFLPNSNNFLNINDLQKITTEIGVQTDLENENNKNISLTQNNYNKSSNYYRSLSQDKNNINKLSLNFEKNYFNNTLIKKIIIKFLIVVKNQD